MSNKSTLLRKALLIFAGLILATYSLGLIGVASAHHDDDQLPDRWESRNGIVVAGDDDAGDKDHDGLNNLKEFNRDSEPDDEDTDDDGMDDGDEVKDSDPDTKLHDDDSDDDGDEDGDEDEDQDGIDNLSLIHISEPTRPY